MFYYSSPKWLRQSVWTNGSSPFSDLVNGTYLLETDDTQQGWFADDFIQNYLQRQGQWKPTWKNESPVSQRLWEYTTSTKQMRMWLQVRAAYRGCNLPKGMQPQRGPWIPISLLCPHWNLPLAKLSQQPEGKDAGYSSQREVKHVESRSGGQTEMTLLN